MFSANLVVRLSTRCPTLSLLPRRFSRTTAMSGTPLRPTAGIIVIGDEILKGQTQDINTYFLARRLKELGVDLRRVSVISDQTQVIADEVKSFADQFTFVFTSGGVGPTHDDVTFEGIAIAFQDKVKRNPQLVEIIDNWTKKFSGGEKPAQSRYKLAEIPSLAQLNFATPERVEAAKLKGIEVLYPLVSVNNVLVFPGIPFLLRKSFDNIAVDLIANQLPTADKKSTVAEVFVTQSEWFITDTLNALVSRHKEVTFGSYPEWTHSYFKTKLTIEADSKDTVDQVVTEINTVMPTIDYDKKPGEKAMDKIEAFKAGLDDLGLANAIDEALGAIEKAFTDYTPDEVRISVNGGKDCVVVVHLIHAYFQKHFGQDQNDKIPRLKAFYIGEKDPFQEVETFIGQMETMYSLDMRKLCGPMKQALAMVFGGEEEGSPKACFLGTRNGDPGAFKQGLFSPTDGDWPRMMRVNPVINWDYHMVWKFIRGLSLPYPSLYDRGYTSLGNTNNTQPNPHLKVTDSLTGDVTYKPAYQLDKGEWERDGRR